MVNVYQERTLELADTGRHNLAACSISQLPPKIRLGLADLIGLIGQYVTLKKVPYMEKVRFGCKEKSGLSDGEKPMIGELATV